MISHDKVFSGILKKNDRTVNHCLTTHPGKGWTEQGTRSLLSGSSHSGGIKVSSQINTLLSHSEYMLRRKCNKIM